MVGCTYPGINGTSKMRTNQVKGFQKIPNIGPAMEEYLVVLGLNEPDELIGKDPYQLYQDLCDVKQKKLDPCVIDVFISAVRYMEGAPNKKWWEYTEERKKHLGI